jgi:diaminopimelate epimerase
MTRSIPFKKYQGAGNDFVIVDNRTEALIGRSDTELIRLICDRRFGIGADGLMLLQNHTGFDFEMVYFNSDGNESTMCGNGGRCLAAFAGSLGLLHDHRCHFIAIDGPHDAVVLRPDWVELRLGDVREVEIGADYFCLNTGSPHYVRFVEDAMHLNVNAEGRAVRYSERFAAEGINVNFVEKTGDDLLVLTYERGVEAETLSCGTGVTASALAYSLKTQQKGDVSIPVVTKGGRLEVKFQAADEGFSDVWLCGPAVEVFEGVYPINKKAASK